MYNNFTIDTMKRVLELEKEKLENAILDIEEYGAKLTKSRKLGYELKRNVNDIENSLNKLENK